MKRIEGWMRYITICSKRMWSLLFVVRRRGLGDIGGIVGDVCSKGQRVDVEKLRGGELSVGRNAKTPSG